MISKASKLSIVKQCKLLNMSRSGFYYRPAPVSGQEPELMRLLDEVHLRHPYFGSRRLRGWLADHGHHLSRKKVVRLMRRMGIVPIYPKKNTSKPGREHKGYPYLLRGLTVDRPNQV
jgi:putative transposase